MKRITFGEMRACKLPPEKADEPDALKALRLNIATDHPDRLRAAVPDELAELVAELTPKAPAKTEGKPPKQ